MVEGHIANIECDVIEMRLNVKNKTKQNNTQNKAHSLTIAYALYRLKMCTCVPSGLT